MKLVMKQYFAIVLVILVSTHEFCSAKYISRTVKDNTEDAKTEFLFNKLQEINKGRNRRSIGTILFGIALFTTAAGFAFDVYLRVEGCCGLYKDACTYAEKYKAAQKVLEDYSTKIDAMWTISQNLLTYVEKGSLKNQEIAYEMKRVTQIHEAITTTVNPSINTYFDKKTSEIENAISAKNNTVLSWNNADVNTAYVSVFDSAIGRLQTMSLYAGSASVTAFMYSVNWYKTMKMQTVLKLNFGDKLNSVHYSKATSLLGGTDADSLIQQTSKARNNADTATRRAGTVMNVVYGITSLITIGTNIWSAILKVQQCEEVRDKIKQAYEQIAPEEAKIIVLHDDMVNYNQNMTEIWSSIYSEISNEQYLTYLSQMKNLSDAVKLETSSIKIQYFIDNIIKTSDASTVYSMQEELLEVLENVTITLDCSYKQVKTFTVAADRCKQALNNLQTIYTQVINDFETDGSKCDTYANIKTTTFESVQSYIKEQAQSEDFNEDCLLNDEITKNLVCEKMCGGYSDTDIAIAASITEDDVLKFKTLCSSCQLSAAEKARICLFKTVPSITIDNILTAYPEPKYSKIEVTQIFENC